MNETAIAFVVFILLSLSAVISWSCISSWDWDQMTVALALASTACVLIGFVLIYRFAPR